MVGPEGVRDGVRIGTVVIAIDIPEEESPVLLVLNEQLIGSDKDVDILSCTQVRDFGHRIHDTPAKYGGAQCLELASSETKIPFQFRRALMCLPF